MFCRGGPHRLRSGAGDSVRFGIARTGGQDDQQPKSKDRSHAVISSHVTIPKLSEQRLCPAGIFYVLFYLRRVTYCERLLNDLTKK